MAFDFPAGPTLNQVYTPPGSPVSYVWDGVAWMRSSSAVAAGGDYVLKAGDTMTGHLTLNADPVQPLHAATKQYTDTRTVPPAGVDGQALVSQTGAAVWGAPVNGGGF